MGLVAVVIRVELFSIFFFFSVWRGCRRVLSSSRVRPNLSTESGGDRWGCGVSGRRLPGRP